MGCDAALRRSIKTLELFSAHFLSFAFGLAFFAAFPRVFGGVSVPVAVVSNTILRWFLLADGVMISSQHKSTCWKTIAISKLVKSTFFSGC